MNLKERGKVWLSIQSKIAKHQSSFIRSDLKDAAQKEFNDLVKSALDFDFPKISTHTWIDDKWQMKCSVCGVCAHRKDEIFLEKNPIIEYIPFLLKYPYLNCSEMNEVIMRDVL